jgi:hypothetical protein
MRCDALEHVTQIQVRINCVEAAHADQAIERAAVSPPASSISIAPSST